MNVIAFLQTMTAKFDGNRITAATSVMAMALIYAYIAECNIVAHQSQHRIIRVISLMPLATGGSKDVSKCRRANLCLKMIAAAPAQAVLSVLDLCC